MVTIDLSAYRALYIQTANEYLSEMKKNFVLFEKNNQDADSLKALHRCAHSLKSQSFVMQYLSTGELNRQLENVFKGIIDKKIMVNQTVLLLIKKAVEKVSESLAEIEKNNQELALQREIDSIKSYIPAV